MQYEVPQFIEVEDKIFGPLTLKQFVYLAGAAGSSVGLFLATPLWIAIPVSLPIIALAVALSFFAVNGRPFAFALESAFYYVFGNKLYLWKQRERTVKRDSAPVSMSTPTGQISPKLSESKLKDLTWSLNIQERVKDNNENSTHLHQFEL